MRYTAQEPVLREMYASLIARSMDVSSRDKAHPSFAEIIKQLSPSEARMIRELAKQPNWAVAEYRAHRHMADQGFDTIARNYTALTIAAGIEKLSDGAVAVDNLIRLRLVEVNAGQRLVDERGYAAVEAHPECVEMARIAVEKGVFVRVDSVKQLLAITEFGRSFAHVCVDLNFRLDSTLDQCDVPYSL
jgi:hypothetical protein